MGSVEEVWEATAAFVVWFQEFGSILHASFEHLRRVNSGSWTRWSMPAHKHKMLRTTSFARTDTVVGIKLFNRVAEPGMPCRLRGACIEGTEVRADKR